MERKVYTGAAAELQKLVEESAEHVQAHHLLASAHWRTGELVAYRQELTTLCRLHSKAHSADAAWQAYGGTSGMLPAKTAQPNSARTLFRR